MSSINEVPRIDLASTEKLHRAAAQNHRREASQQLTRLFDAWPREDKPARRSLRPSMPKVGLCTVVGSGALVAERLLPPLIESCGKRSLAAPGPHITDRSLALLQRAGNHMAHNPMLKNAAEALMRVVRHAANKAGDAVGQSQMESEWLVNYAGRAHLAADAKCAKKAREAYEHASNCQNVYFRHLQQAFELIAPPLLGVWVGTTAASAWPMLAATSGLLALLEGVEAPGSKVFRSDTTMEVSVPASGETAVIKHVKQTRPVRPPSGPTGEGVVDLAGRAALGTSGTFYRTLAAHCHTATRPVKEMLHQLTNEMSSELMFPLIMLGQAALTGCMMGLGAMAWWLPPVAAGALLGTAVWRLGTAMHASRRAWNQSVVDMDRLTRLKAPESLKHVRFTRDGQAITAADFAAAVSQQVPGHYGIVSRHPSETTQLLCLLKEYLHQDSALIPRHQRSELTPLQPGRAADEENASSTGERLQVALANPSVKTILVDDCRGNVSSKDMEDFLTAAKKDRCVIEARGK